MSRCKRGGLILSRLAEGWYTAFMSVATGGPEMDENHRPDLTERTHLHF